MTMLGVGGDRQKDGSEVPLVQLGAGGWGGFWLTEG